MKTSFDKFMASNAVSPVKIEMALLDDVTKAKNGFEQSAKQARLMVAAADNNTNETLMFLKNALKISDEYLQKAKDLGSPELIKQGETIKAGFAGSLSKWQKISNDIKKIQF
jgi:hypothetical protein